MNKTAIKNFAVWARNKLIADITYRAGLMGIAEDGIKAALPQSTKDTEFYDIGTKEPYSITGEAVRQRRRLAELIDQKTKSSDYKTAYRSVLEEVAYTWFNRLIAIRFMEVNDYLPSRIRVLSSESKGKLEPDLVTTPFDAELELTEAEKETVVRLKTDNQVDDLFRLLFVKQCNALNKVLPKLFEKTADYTELLLNVSVTDQDGVVYHLVHDIDEDDFNIEKGGQVEIIGWLYQYYNTEPKDEAFALLKKNVKITKERIPAATQLFTPDWIVRYMVENSLGRLWLEGHPNNDLKAGWKYYLDEAEQEADVEMQLAKIREEYKAIQPVDIKVIDPCMGSGHILVYAFDVLMQIYEAAGYTQREAAKSILENNLYGLDIDDRAFQLAYFAVMMKARQYNRRILNGETDCHVYSIQESNTVNRNHLKYLGAGMDELERNNALNQITGLLDTFVDAKEYGSILNVDACDWDLLRRFVAKSSEDGQMTMDSFGLEDTKEQLRVLVDIGQALAQKYDAVVTNPPYVGGRNMNNLLLDRIVTKYPEGKADLFSAFILRCGVFTKPNGFYAMITQHSWMFLSSFETLRNKVIHDNFINMAHLGARAFEEISGEVVQTVSWIARKHDVKHYRASFVRLVNGDSQQSKERKYLNHEELYIREIEMFSTIPGNAFAYWLGNPDMFCQGRLLEIVANPRQGLKTLNNDYFIRYWYEIKRNKMCTNAKNAEESVQSGCKWFPLNHGGEFRQYYGNNFCVVNWENNGAEMKANAIRKYNCITRTITNISYYFKEGITWSVLCSAPSFRWYGDGFIFSNGGQCIVPERPDELIYLTGLLNSKVTGYILNALSPTLGFESGYLKKLPILEVDSLSKEKVIRLTHEIIGLCKTDWDSYEYSWDFEKHFLLTDDNYISDAFGSWERATKASISKYIEIGEELNNIFINVYGLSNELCAEIDKKYISLREADIVGDIKSLISYAVGCMFGRYSLDVDGLAYAGGEWDDSKYSSFIPDKDNILPITDEEYFSDDIIGLFCAWLKKVYGEDTLEDNLDFIAKALGNKGNTSREIIRNYFLNDFIREHSKMYQKCPIYWLFDSGKQNGFKALVYMHRYDENTIGNLRIDYLHRMERVYDNEIARMQDIIDNSKVAREVTQATKRREKLQKQLKECKEYDERIAHLALARIPIDLDDGVKVNYEKVQTVDGVKYPVLAKI